MLSVSLFFIALLLLPQSVTPRTIQVMSPLTTGVARAIKNQEPEWHYTAGVCTCPQLMPSQISHDVGTWDHTVAGNKREWIDMDVYVVGTPTEAADWMSKFSRGEFGLVCSIERYELAEEAYLLTCPKKHRYHINYRKGRTLVEVSGDVRSDVERFASYAFKLLPDS